MIELDMTHVTISVMFVATILIREWSNSKERIALVERLMAKSLPEYNYELVKKEARKERKVRGPIKGVATDAEMAEWEKKRESQVSEINAEVEAHIQSLKSRVATKQQEPENVKV